MSTKFQTRFRRCDFVVPETDEEVWETCVENHDSLEKAESWLRHAVLHSQAEDCEIVIVEE